MPIAAGFAVPHPPLIVPEVGRGRERGIQKTIDSYRAVARRIGDIRPETIILISPHSILYADYFHVSPGAEGKGSLKRFGAKAPYAARYDEPLVQELCRLCGAQDFPAGVLGERDPELDHGTLVPLHFVNQCLPDYRLVRCSLSGLSRRDHYRFGMLLRRAADTLGRKAVIIASGDLSHKLAADGPYGFAPEGPELDKRITEALRTARFGEFFTIDQTLCEKGAECGLNAFVVMAGAFDRRAVEARFHSYEGPFGVGYAVCAFMDAGPDETRDFLARDEESGRLRLQSLRDAEDLYVRIARETLEGYVTGGKAPPVPDGLPEELTKRRAGVFVSIKKHGGLRGCIGTTAPTAKCVAEEIRQNAVSSGTRDPRFPPVTARELPELVYSVDVLSPAEPCEKEALDPARYGVIVTSGFRRGLLLPNLEGVDTVDEQIRIARQKAGIGEGEAYGLERFEVARHT